MGALRIFTLGIVVAASTVAVSASADELIIPYTCEIDRGTPHLTASSGGNIYQIIGPREDQPFSACRPSSSAECEMMMVHKFTIECGGQRVAWAKVAASARALGVELPAHLPPGFAPISRLAGRFVLPGLRAVKARHHARRNAGPVARQCHHNGKHASSGRAGAVGHGGRLGSSERRRPVRPSKSRASFPCFSSR